MAVYESHKYIWFCKIDTISCLLPTCNHVPSSPPSTNNFPSCFGWHTSLIFHEKYQQKFIDVICALLSKQMWSSCDEEYICCISVLIIWMYLNVSCAFFMSWHCSFDLCILYHGWLLCGFGIVGLIVAPFDCARVTYEHTGVATAKH